MAAREPQNVTLLGSRIFADVVSGRVAEGGTRRPRAAWILNVLGHLQTGWAGPPNGVGTQGWGGRGRKGLRQPGFSAGTLWVGPDPGDVWRGTLMV